MLSDLIRSGEVGQFIVHYLNRPSVEHSVYFPTSTTTQELKSEWAILLGTLSPQVSPAFVDDVTTTWLAPGLIRYCPQETYRALFEAIEKKKGYFALKEMRRLAYQGYYSIFPHSFDSDSIQSEWQQKLSHFIGQQCSEKLISTLTNQWSISLDHTIELLKRSMRSGHVDSYINQMYFLTIYNQNVMAIMSYLNNELTFEEQDRWERILNLRLKRLTPHPAFDQFSQKLSLLLRSFNPFQLIIEAIENDDEKRFLLEYACLSEAGFPLRFPMVLNDVNGSKKIWKEVMEELELKTSDSFLLRLSQLWTKSLTKLHEKHEYWHDQLLFELIVDLET